VANPESERQLVALLRINREPSLSPFKDLLAEMVREGMKNLVASNDDRQVAQAQGAVRILQKIQDLIESSETRVK
jgi:hypothetical protein